MKNTIIPIIRGTRTPISQARIVFPKLVLCLAFIINHWITNPAIGITNTSQLNTAVRIVLQKPRWGAFTAFRPNIKNHGDTAIKMIKTQKRNNKRIPSPRACPRLSSINVYQLMFFIDDFKFALKF